MKFLLVLLFVTTLIIANSLIVKESDVMISLNNQTKNLKKDDKLILDNGSTICFKSGNGRVIINEDIQLMKVGSCETIPVPKSFNWNDTFSKVTTYVVTYLNPSEMVKDGVSTKGINDLDDEKDIILENTVDELILYSKDFGPHPITINLKNEKGEIIISVENKNNDITFFKVLSSTLKTGYLIEVLNGFGESILRKKIIKAY